MPRQTTVHHISLHASWPDGEPQTVRDAYDALLEEQRQSAKDQKR
ncbi:hypothetical protein [Nonomuraea dietziae]|uniref:Putative heme/steroid binding protein n=1 Tax=Nonomuraea dietziae TaxID=65515 RepID=A0A7W5V6E1_9ACTN|nr:hypothetical protein [Nonomuraea dietziae]MBB3728120.1 putative heme/steroid binding protein [Nonomuraea dietziae]